MKTTRAFATAVSLIGCGLSLSGFALWLVLGLVETSVSGPGGLAVAILFGCGLCTWLLAALYRMLYGSALPLTNSGTEAEQERHKTFAELRVLRAKCSICYAALATVLTYALIVVGIPVAFIGFDFAHGTNDLGLVIILTGLVVGVVAIISGLIAIILGWIAARTNGNFKWLLAAIAIPLIQVTSYFVSRYLTN